jgi:Protein of unknown function (DUF3551)
MVSIRRGRLVLLCSIVLAAAAAVDARHTASAGGQRAPWCAYMGGSFGDYDCSYYTFEQCMQTAWGVGNRCAPNPRLWYEPAPAPRRRVQR